jgi:hypothetical protein
MAIPLLLWHSWLVLWSTVPLTNALLLRNPNLLNVFLQNTHVEPNPQPVHPSPNITLSF